MASCKRRLCTRSTCGIQQERRMKHDFKPWFELRAIAEDEATQEFFAIIEYRDIDGGVRSVHVPRTELDDKKSLKKILTNKGAYFSEDEDENEKALLALRRHSGEGTRCTFARGLGWYDDNYRIFVLPRRVIGRL